MMSKIKALLGSIRFWMLFVAMCSVLSAHYFPAAEFFFNTVAGFLAAVVGIGSVDSAAQKAGGPSLPVPPVGSSTTYSGKATTKSVDEE